MMKTNYLFIGMAALMMAACSNNENEPHMFLAPLRDRKRC